ncbi:MAG TPA: class I SAM-dependent methyltransferase [Holophagaceae bacterium]|nr:class I SAM-dependent methyltransferase [Holophagaceae bacterium]
MPTTTPAPDLASIKTKQQATWASGDYGHIGVRLQIVGETLCESVDVHGGEKVLDVAAGNGNASLAAARRFADVTSTDYVAGLLDQGRLRANADRLPITFQEADVENLPFRDMSFDVVLSTFGVMFAPDQERSSSELIRVTKAGGRIGLANWTPEGFIGHLFKLVGAFVAPPAGLKSPLLWGTEARIAELFGPHAASIQTTRKTYAFRFHSVDHFIDYFRTNYGPTHKAFLALDESGRQDFTLALREFIGGWNRSTRNGLVVPSEYLEVVVTR